MVWICYIPSSSPHPPTTHSFSTYIYSVNPNRTLKSQYESHGINKVITIKCCVFNAAITTATRLHALPGYWTDGLPIRELRVDRVMRRRRRRRKSVDKVPSRNENNFSSNFISRRPLETQLLSSGSDFHGTFWHKT